MGDISATIGFALLMSHGHALEVHDISLDRRVRHADQLATCHLFDSACHP